MIEKNNIVSNELKLNKKIIEKHNIKNVNKDNLIQLYLIAIDDKNKNKVEILYNKNIENNIEKDIVYEIYHQNELNSERLQFFLENCTTYLNISSSLIKKINER